MVAASSACSEDAVEPPASTATTPLAASSTAAATSTPTAPAATSSVATSPVVTTADVPAFDCPALDAAQQEMDEAFSSELDRLEVRRGDPRAQSVYALVTTREGPSYYAAVLTAAPPELTGDAALVLGYYQRLAVQAGGVDAGSGSTEDLTAAMSALDHAAAAVDDPATGTEVVDAQERLRAAVERACSGPSASSTTSTTSTTSTEGSSPAG